MSFTYSDNSYNGESPLVSSLPSLVSITTSLPAYGSSRKEDNDAFDSIYYNPPVEKPRFPTTPPPPSPSYHPKTPDYIQNPQPLPPVPTPARSPIHVPTPLPHPWTPPTTIPAYVEPEVGPAFTWPPPPMTKYTARGPNMMLANTYTKHLAFLDQQETQAHQGVQIALVYRRAPPPPNQDLYIPRTIDFNGPLPTNNVKAKVDKVVKLAEIPGPSWDKWNKFTGSQQLAFQEKYWA
ncbi:hypothetical protein JAAARDRAFT_201036 [Jaapia argillacea MUCL 33604]|uniref:Uncharacterized protein n=1 Tax=Jaapia argillacea MUCL 33604 TaxID=933084 RepID=A0A067P5Y0_9AGAM|nr:hypothetical protein JAAARDRAFT_201036 [Jaapia argillacea MUCL 33604]